LSITLRARADARALAGAAVLGSMVGLAIGGAYLAGGMARAAVVHAQISRLAVASDGFSESALSAASDHDASALAIARRHDPYADADVASERRLAQYANNLQARFDAGARSAPSQGRVERVSLTKPTTVVAARPFQMRGALDESRDLECLTQAVYYEARGETRAGQAAVAQVVLNRTRHPAYPKTVCGVVFQRTRTACQFSFACDGSVYRRVEPGAWRRAEQVAAKALNGKVMPEVGNATHFHVASINPGWGARLLRVSQVGSHIFYRFGGRAGSARAFTETVEPSQLEAAPLPAETATDTPVYASLSLAPLANSVASTVANSVVSTVTAGAELVAAAAGSKAHAEPAARPAVAAPVVAKPAAPLAVPAAAVAAPVPAASPAPTAKAEDPAKPVVTAG
jgi:spore germination cell wall hydrolase CwlJ-like protein